MMNDISVPVICSDEHPRFTELTSRLAVLYRAVEDGKLVGVQLRKKKNNRDTAILLVQNDDGEGYSVLGEIFYTGYEPEFSDFVSEEGMADAPASEATH